MDMYISSKISKLTLRKNSEIMNQDTANGYDNIIVKSFKKLYFFRTISFLVKIIIRKYCVFARFSLHIQSVFLGKSLC